MIKVKCFGTGSSGNCYLATFTNGMNVLLDLGVDPKKVKREINMNDISFAFVSHNHQDHSKYVQNFARSKFLIYEGTNYKEVFKTSVEGKFDANLVVFPVSHGEETCCGCIISSEEEKLLYITDFSNCVWNLSNYQFTTIMLECNFVEEHAQKRLQEGIDTYVTRRQINTHLGLNGLMLMLSKLDLSKCDELILVHKSQRYDEDIESDMVATILSKYNIKLSVAKQFGGFNYYG